MRATQHGQAVKSFFYDPVARPVEVLPMRMRMRVFVCVRVLRILCFGWPRLAILRFVEDVAQINFAAYSKCY